MKNYIREHVKSITIDLSEKIDTSNSRNNSAVSLYVQVIPLNLRTQIKEYLKFDKKEQIINLNLKLIFISNEITQTDKDKNYKYRVIGSISKIHMFLLGLEHIRLCILMAFASIVLIIFVMLFSIRKQFIEPSILLFDYIKNDGHGSELTSGWSKFWQPWFSLVKDRFALKRQHINALENDLNTKDNK